MAEERTDWAEDRTILANERTFSGWIRTGLSTVALGLGVHAIFGKADPTWAAKSVSTVFVIVGIVIFWGASRAAEQVLSRLNSHVAKPLMRRKMVILSRLLSAASIALCVVLWAL